MKRIIEKYLTYLRIERNASPHTIKSYRKDLGDFSTFLQQEELQSFKDITQITRFTIRAWMGHLSDAGMAKSTIGRKISCLKSFFKYTFARGITEENPAARVSVPKKEKRLPTSIQQADISRMFDLMPSETDWDVQNRAIMELFYATGIRLSELVSINVRDVNMSSDFIRIMGKGSKERYVPYGGSAREVLLQWIRLRRKYIATDAPEADKSALFLSKSGRRIYTVAVQRMVRKCINRVMHTGKKSPHVLRHSFATHMMNKGADIRVIKELLGHAALTSTQIYVHTSVEHLKSVYARAHPRQLPSGHSEEEETPKPPQKPSP
ncbi:MAG: site-specific tyrosine recombinase/integron integrase [Cyclonatronaceae bacterium]